MYYNIFKKISNVSLEKILMIMLWVNKQSLRWRQFKMLSELIQ